LSKLIPNNYYFV